MEIRLDDLLEDCTACATEADSKVKSVGLGYGPQIRKEEELFPCPSCSGTKKVPTESGFAVKSFLTYLRQRGQL